MTSKHTPGPWVYDTDNRGTRRVFADMHEIVSARAAHGQRRLPRGERDANAHLIAAAPDGWDMASEIVKSYEAHTDGFARQVLRSHYERAKAFLAKAKGKSDD